MTDHVVDWFANDSEFDGAAEAVTIIYLFWHLVLSDFDHFKNKFGAAEKFETAVTETIPHPFVESRLSLWLVLGTKMLLYDWSSSGLQTVELPPNSLLCEHRSLILFCWAISLPLLTGSMVLELLSQQGYGLYRGNPHITPNEYGGDGWEFPCSLDHPGIKNACFLLVSASWTIGVWDGLCNPCRNSCFLKLAMIILTRFKTITDKMASSYSCIECENVKQQRRLTFDHSVSVLRWRDRHAFKQFSLIFRIRPHAQSKVGALFLRHKLIP